MFDVEMKRHEIIELIIRLDDDMRNMEFDSYSDCELMAIFDSLSERVETEFCIGLYQIIGKQNGLDLSFSEQFNIARDIFVKSLVWN